MQIIQIDLFGKKANDIEGFERPEYSESDFPKVKCANKKPQKDLNYFYIDFYGQADEFQKIFKTIQMMGGIEGNHKISSKVFSEIVRYRVGAKPQEPSQ